MVNKRYHFSRPVLSSLIVFVFVISWQIMGATVLAENQYRSQKNVSTIGGISHSADSHMVIIDGRKLFRLVGIESYPAKKRTAKTVSRIKQLAQDPSFDPENLVVGEKDGVYTIFGNDLAIVRISYADTLLEGDFLTEVYAEKVVKKQIERAIKEYRFERLPETIKINLTKAVVRTSLLAIILFLLFWSFKATDRLFERHFRKKIEALESKSKRILKAQQIWNVLQYGSRVTRVVLVLGIIYFFLNFVLGLFPWSRFIANTLLSYTIDPLRTLWKAFVDYLPSLFFLVIIYLLFRYLLRFARAFFDQIDRGQMKISGFDTEWALPTYRIVRVLIIVLGIVIAYPYIPGSGSDAFKGISILAGVLLSLGSSSLIANIIAGYTMTYRRAFKVGDRVKIGPHVGDVKDVRLMETHLRSLKNEEIVVPNSQILSGEVTNFSKMASNQGLILHTTVGIGYEVPWRQVRAMLLMAAEQIDGIKRKPEPFVLVKELGDFGVMYELNVFCRNVEKMTHIYSDLHCKIQDVFNEYDVAIMTPHYVADTQEPKTVPKDRWYAPPAPPPAE